MWASVLLFIQFIGILLHVADNLINPPHSLMDFVNHTIQFPFFDSTGTVAIILAVTINRKKMSQFINCLPTLDKCLFSHPNNIYKQQNKRFLMKVVCTTVSSLVIFMCDTYYYFTYDIIYVVTIYVPDFIWSINELQFMNIVEMLKIRLTTLNAKISMVFTEKDHSENVSRISRKSPRRRTRNRHVSVSYVGSSINAEILRIEIPEKCTGRTLKMVNRESIVASHILKLSEIYNRLYEMCCLINSMYGYMLLQEFTAYTVCLIVDGYSLVCFLIALYKAEDPLLPPGGHVALILWNISNLIRPFLVCLSCQRVNNEFKSTMDHIQALKLHPEISREISNQLKLFSNQIKHCRLEFSVCDFFDINLSLFCIVVLTVTTYIIVLVLLER